MNVLPLEEATSRLRADRELLLAQVADLTEAELTARYRVASGPLGDSCDSLHDLVGHVLMWDEINLAVLSEAAAGRAHWSLDPRWETPAAGRLLNRSGVEAARHLPAPLLLHRFQAVHDAVLDVFGRYREQDWAGPRPAPARAQPATVRAAPIPERSAPIPERAAAIPALAQGIGGLAQKVWTVPGQPAFWHAAIHLGKLPTARPSAGPAGPP